MTTESKSTENRPAERLNYEAHAQCPQKVHPCFAVEASQNAHKDCWNPQLKQGDLIIQSTQIWDNGFSFWAF